MREQLTNTVTRNYMPELVIQTNSVIRNTYILLSMTLLFSAFTAWLGMHTQALPINPLLCMAITMGLLFVTTQLRDSVLGLVSVFALTGFMGYTLGPILNMIIQGFSNGPQLIATSLGMTGMLFLGLSGYALTTRKDFSYLSGFLFVTAMVAMLAGIASIFFHVDALSLMVSGAFVVISSGYILFQTSQMIHGGERNYIMATISLYVQIYNLFVSLLQILMYFSGRRD